MTVLTVFIGDSADTFKVESDPSQTAVCIFSPDGALLEANQCAYDSVGLSPLETVGKRYDQLSPFSYRADVVERVATMLREAAAGRAVREELSVLVADGRIAVMDCMASPIRDLQGRVVRIVGTGVEITPRKNAEASLLRVNRALRMLKNCNEILARASVESELSANICRTIVETGDYPLAWLGVAQLDPACMIRAVASAGGGPGYVESLRTSWADSSRGRGPTGRAVREGTVQVCRDIENDPSFAPWRPMARKAGYASSIALPVVCGRDRLVLNIYSSQADAFDAEEISLLSDLAADFAYRLRALRADVAHRRAEEERERQQAQLARLARVSRLQAAMNAAILRIHDRDELLGEACRLATEVGGYDRAVVSLVEPDGRHARPRYRAGHGDDFPEPEVLEISDGTEPDTSLTSRALRTGEIAVCGDLSISEPPVAMRDRLLRLGYGSVVAIPLIVDGTRLGALTLASRDAGINWDEELLLLQDMTATLSFALRAQRQADAVQLLAFYDPLTGLANRALLCKRLNESIARVAAPIQHPVVAAFDVHQLSKINDSYGRHFGDLLLQEVATRLRRYADDEERIGYIGGGTFVLVEPELVSSEESIVSLLEGTVFAEPFTIEGRSIRVTFHSGVARYPMDGTDSDTLVQKAEAALRHAKDTGEQYIHYALELHSQIAERIAIETRLQSALDKGQFEVHYQPQIGVQSGRIESVEALLRWNDPERGLVAPADFLSVLEASAMIVPVGSWVLQRALADCRRWADLGLGPIRVAVNVSSVQIRRRAFVPLVLDLLRLNLAGRPGYGLDLEITETAVLQDIEGASRKLQELRDVGVRIALDDFGTGYSSLGLLSKLPVDLVKIDKSFVAGLPGDPASTTLVTSIVQLASAFGLVAVAEGVETEEQMSLLKQMSCHKTQGYLHCRPVPAAHLERLLANQSMRKIP